MKGTVSPELRNIFRDPEMLKKFVVGFHKLGHTSSATIDLGNDQSINVTRGLKTHPRRRRNIFQLLLGK